MVLESFDHQALDATKLFSDFIKWEKDIRHFFEAGDFKSIDAYTECARKYENASETNKDSVSSALLTFNRRFNPSKKTLENIEKLKDSETFTVTTGQQTVLFGGPLFTFLKAISAIHLSRLLSDKLQKTVIPVFWLADEDHDYEEISETFIPSQSDLTKITLPNYPSEVHAAAKLVLPDEIHSLHELLGNVLQETEFKSDILKVLSDCWSPGKNQVDAFGCQLMHFFGKYGLVLAGSVDNEIKKIIAPLIKKAVVKADELELSLKSVSEDLDVNYHQQASWQGTTLFYHHPEKGRLKINRENGRWYTESDTWSTNELLFLVDTKPELFSPNVFLRPAIQQYLLPNLAYVGGPSEIAYHAQMKAFFTEMGVLAPIIVPRCSACLAEPAIARIYSEIGFEYPDYKQRMEDLHKKYIKMQDDENSAVFFKRWKQAFSDLTNQKKNVLTKKDASLKGAVQSFEARTIKEIDKLEQKLIRALKQKEQVQLKRIDRISKAFFPDNTPQERKINAVYFMGKYGIHLFDDILNDLSNELDFSSKHQLIFIQ